MFYLTTLSTHFIYSYMALYTTQLAREETRFRHMGYSFRLAARVLLYASSHNTYHGLCYTSRGALAGTMCVIRYIVSNDWRERLALGVLL